MAKIIPDKTSLYTLLDVGCGVGDFCGLLTMQNYTNIQYTGIDIVPEMVAAARKKQPQQAFQEADIFDSTYQQHFDLVICSGALNIIFDQEKNQLAFIKNAIKKMYSLSNKATAFNLLSRKAMLDFPQDDRFYYSDPAEILAFCRELALNATLIENYLPHDFTIILKK